MVSYVREEKKRDSVLSDMNLIDDDGHIVRDMWLPDHNFKNCFADLVHLGQ